MKIVKVELPENYIKNIEELVDLQNHYLRESERLRYAIRELIRIEHTAELQSSTKILENTNEPYASCIFCGRLLSNYKKPYKCKKFQIIELRPCCTCLKKFKGKTLNDLPEEIIENIKSKVSRFLSK